MLSRPRTPVFTPATLHPSPYKPSGYSIPSPPPPVQPDATYAASPCTYIVSHPGSASVCVDELYFITVALPCLGELTGRRLSPASFPTRAQTYTSSAIPRLPLAYPVLPACPALGTLAYSSRRAVEDMGGSTQALSGERWVREGGVDQVSIGREITQCGGST